MAILDIVRHRGTVIAFALMVAAFAVLLPDTFLTARNLLNISQQVSMLAVVAITMTIVMAMGDFDLSVGSMASLSGIAAAVTFRETGSVALGIALALVIGLAGGVLNGWLVAKRGILPFVATLGTLTIFSGLAFLAADGKTIFGGDIPAAFSNLAKGGIPLPGTGAPPLAFPSLTIMALVVLALAWFVLEKRPFGRHLYVIGNNREAARLAGIPVANLRLAAFALTGLGAALAGLMYAARVASANPVQGSGLMLDAIAAVFLGMTMDRQNEPRVINTLIGVAMLGVLGNGLTQLSVNSYVREVLVGAIILAAVAWSSGRAARSA
ncbi:MAG: ABC transporter permease [Rhizobiaceae bacterium]|nr:ABC transporter permease [Rhizobiaceae bacterium]